MWRYNRMVDGVASHQIHFVVNSFGNEAKLTNKIANSTSFPFYDSRFSASETTIATFVDLIGWQIQTDDAAGLLIVKVNIRPVNIFCHRLCPVRRSIRESIDMHRCIPWLKLITGPTMNVFIRMKIGHTWSHHKINWETKKSDRQIKRKTRNASAFNELFNIFVYTLSRCLLQCVPCKL